MSKSVIDIRLKTDGDIIDLVFLSFASEADLPKIRELSEPEFTEALNAEAEADSARVKSSGKRAASKEILAMRARAKRSEVCDIAGLELAASLIPTWLSDGPLKGKSVVAERFERNSKTGLLTLRRRYKDD